MKDMMQSPNGRVPMVSDKELSDLLDFSAMFSPPTGASKNAGQPAQGAPFKQGGGGGGGGGQMENSSTWSNGPRPSPNYESSRNYEYEMSERGGMNESNYVAGKSKEYGMPYMPREPGVPQPALALGMPSSGSLSPHGKSTASYYSMYNSSRRRPMPEQPPIPATGLGKRRKPTIGVYSPAGSDDYQSESPSYSSPKPPGMQYSESYYLDGAHSGHEGGGWSNGMGPASNYPSSTLLTNSTSHSQTSTNYTQDPLTYSQEAMMNSNSGLPPMTSFRPEAHPSARSPLNGSEPNLAGRGSTAASAADNSQTGVTLGKALASIYSTSEQTNSSYPSNPSTPVSSPPPMTGPWPRSGSQPSPAGPGYNGGAGPGSVPGSANPSGENLHSLSRMEECLNDAIHVLQRHATQGQGMNPMAPGMPPEMMNGLPPHSSSGLPPGISHPYGHPAQYGVDHPHMGGPPSSVPDNHRNAMSGAPLPPSEIAQPQQPFSSVQNDLMGHDQGDGLKIEKVKTKSIGAKPKKEEKMDITKPDDNKSDNGRSSNSGKTKKRTTDDLEEAPPKQEKEKERRSANNARERIRVRDINEAFKELGRMCQLHLNTDKAQTKLLILHQAVNVITSLETQVRDRNLNPKAACLKRREEEKVDELPNRGLGPTSDHLGPQHGLQGSSSLVSSLMRGYNELMDNLGHQPSSHLQQQLNEYGIHHGLDLSTIPPSSSATVTNMPPAGSLELLRTSEPMQTSVNQISPEDNL
ncbi:transcription factor 12-like isoform X2 [Antedon mediterranea]|uniref:transcription factor 12-like isoform X2 n=1 Tax=Antedon mediterranea TaxID=105859 RepID=UPI003AF9751A